MSGPEWASWAERDGRAWTTSPMSRSTGARRVGLHWTASSKNASPKSQADYMAADAGLNTGYHLLVPIVDNGYRPLQLRPFSVAAGSFYNSGQLDRSPNKEGTVGIQIAMICTTGDDPFTTDPGPWWPHCLELLDAWDIPRHYVWGNWTPTGVMPTEVWYSAASGYTAHKQVPEVPGTVRKPDPGPVDDMILWEDTMTPEQDRMLREVHSMLGALHYATIPEDGQVTGQGESLVRLRTIDNAIAQAEAGSGSGAHTHEVGPAVPVGGAASAAPSGRPVSAS